MIGASPTVAGPGTHLSAWRPADTCRRSWRRGAFARGCCRDHHQCYLGSCPVGTFLGHIDVVRLVRPSGYSEVVEAGRRCPRRYPELSAWVAGWTGTARARSKRQPAARLREHQRNGSIVTTTGFQRSTRPVAIGWRRAPGQL